MSTFPPLPHPQIRDANPAPTLRRLVALCANRVSRVFAEHDRRRRLARLLAYDDRMLDDMGLTRYAIEDALKLPLSVNAIKALHGRCSSGHHS